MGQLVDFIDSEVFRRHTAMCIGTYEFSGVSWFLLGYDHALNDTDSDHADELRGFREWLHARFDGSGNIDWAGLIIEQFGAGRDATDAFFQLFDEFREEMATRGLDAILQDHLEYEKKRYGGPASSSLR